MNGLKCELYATAVIDSLLDYVELRETFMKRMLNEYITLLLKEQNLALIAGIKIYL